MNLLSDAHLLPCESGTSSRLSKQVRALTEDPWDTPLFGAAALREVVTGNAPERESFRVDRRLLRRGLPENGSLELPVRGAHAVAVVLLPSIHADP